jgi:hypothetical protein
MPDIRVHAENHDVIKFTGKSGESKLAGNPVLKNVRCDNDAKSPPPPKKKTDHGD